GRRAAVDNTKRSLPAFRTRTATRSSRPGRQAVRVVTMTRRATAPARRRHSDAGVAQLPQGQPAPVRPAARFLILLVAVALGCYLNTLRGALIYDDVNAIVRNPAVTDVDLARIVTTGSWFSPNGYMDVYRPATTATFAANYAVHGVAPLGYHLVNV